MAKNEQTEIAIAETPPIRVTLERGDFLYFNWVLAFERPVLPFFLYGFIFFNLASLLGVWPSGRIFAGAILVPAIGYCIFLMSSARGLWEKLPQLRKPRTYRFGEEAFQVKVENEESIAYRDLTGVLESRRGLYLARPDGSHEILPKKAFAKWPELARLLRDKAPRYKRSTFL